LFVVLKSQIIFKQSVCSSKSHQGNDRVSRKEVVL
jgi:hypothetical protein